MSEKKSFRLAIVSGHVERHVEWPILRATDKAVLVQTGGGELWLPLWRFADRRWLARRVPELLNLIAELAESAGSARVRVEKAGAGSSSKSGKFHVEVVSTTVEPWGEKIQTRRRRTLTLPLSQIQGERGSWTAPVWVFKKHLRDGERLARVEWPGLEAVREELMAVVADVDAAAEERRRAGVAEKKRVQEARRADLDRRWNALDPEGRLALEFCRRRYTLAQLAEKGGRLSHWPVWPRDRKFGGLDDLEFLLGVAQAHPKFPAWVERNRSKVLTPNE